MSLINDALRRAKQSQQETAPPPPAPGLRPVEPPPHSARHATGNLVPAGIAAVALLTLVLLWELSRQNGSSGPIQGTNPISVAARPLTPVGGASASSRVTPNSDHKLPSEPAGGSALAAAEPSNMPPTTAAVVSGTNPASTASEPTDTNHPATSEPASPPPLKLQSIVFNPKRPSAMINGRIIFVGDKIREQRVMVIRPDEVVLAGLGHTNILSLEP